MNTRLDVVGASVLPFQFPPLKESAAEAVNGVAPVAAEIDAPAVPEEEAPAVAADEAAAAIAAELARGHDEGLARGLAEGRQAGYEAGFAAGVKAGEASLVESAERLAAILAKLGGPLAALEEPVEEAIAALALEVARCVIGDEVKRSRAFLVRLVREAIAKVPLEMGAPWVLLNPTDIDLIRSLVPEIESGSASLIADDTIEIGGCLVVADGGDGPVKDRRWNTRAAEGVSQVNLTLSSRWRTVMLTLFDGEEE